MTLEIRPARPEDKEAVAAFCAHIWEGHDYIPQVWDHWLTDPEGVLLVGTWEDRPVSVVRACFYTPGEAWLEGMRVDPAYQGRGIATAVFRRLVEVLEERGAWVARLLTTWRNVSVHRMCAHLGFRLLFRARGRSRLLEVGRPGGIRPLEEDEFDLARSLLQRQGVAARKTSSFLEATHTLYAVGGGVYLSLSAGRLRQHLAEGQVWVWEERGQPRSIAVVTPHRWGRPGTYQVGILEGPTGACGALLDALVRREQVPPAEDPERPPMVRIHIPQGVPRLHRAAAAAGYRFPPGWRGEMWLFERVLRSDGDESV